MTVSTLSGKNFIGIDGRYAGSNCKIYMLQILMCKEAFFIDIAEILIYKFKLTEIEKVLLK